MKFVALTGMVAFTLLMACSGGSKPPLGKTCATNSDCNNPLSCTFGTCHAACAEARDCPTGQLCVKSAAGPVCQLPAETHCAYKSQCPVPLTCALDRQCRTECQTDVDCPTKTQKCVQPDKICAEAEEINPTTMRLKNAQATPVPDAPDGGALDRSATDGGAVGGNGDGGGAVDANMTGTDGPVVNTCPSPQTTFGNIAQGDSNPNFTSGVGVRSGNQLFVFTAYAGPSANVDAGADAGAAGNFIYVQSFDPSSGKSQGPAVPLFQAADGPLFYVDDVSVAPTGEIVLLHSHASASDSRQSALFASFLAVGAPDAGPAGLTVRTVPIENAVLGEPHAVWSVANSAFVLSWKYFTQAWYVRARRFLPDGRMAGGDTNIIANPYGQNNDISVDEGRIGTSGAYLGSGSRNPATGLPYLTILDKEGLQVGDVVQLSSSVGVSHWIVVGGIAGGFVTLYNSGGSAYGVYTPIGGDGKVKADAPDGGIDGGMPTFAGFSFPTTASTAQAISDDTGGNGGIGAVLLEQNGASFLYIKTDGLMHLSTGTVISSASGIQAGISNYRGSFVVSLFESTTHAAQVVASGCGP